MLPGAISKLTPELCGTFWTDIMAGPKTLLFGQGTRAGEKTYVNWAFLRGQFGGVLARSLNGPCVVVVLESLIT